MNVKFSPLILIFLLIAAWSLMPQPIFLPDDEEQEAFEEQEGNEESNKKHQWEHMMLADPATGTVPKGIRFRELAFLRQLQQENFLSYKNTRGANWNMRGPWNVGGRTRAFCIDIQDERHLLAGGVSGGIWQSFDAGGSWTKVSDSNAHPGVVSICQDTRPGKTHIWYALSGELTGTSASGGKAFYLGDGAFLSLDNGNTWKPIAATAVGVPGSLINYAYQGGWNIATSPVDTVPACVYMACYGTIFRSTDTGTSWTAVLGSLFNSAYYTSVRVSSNGTVYATLSSDGSPTKGFFRSADGVNFVNITPTFLKQYNRTVMDINPNNENEVYFLSELPDSASGGVKTSNYEGTPEYVSLIKYTYLSGDGSGAGGMWTDLSANLPVHSPNQFDRFNCQGGYDLFVRAQPGTASVFIGGTNVYRSTDGFTTPGSSQQIGGYGIATQLANFVSYANHHPDQHDLFFLKSSSAKAYSVSDGGVKYTDNANASTVEWQEKSLGYVTSQVYSVAIDESKPFDQWLLSGFQDNANYITYSNQKTANWRMTINGDGAHNYIAPGRAWYIISTQLGNVRKVLLDERGNVIRRMRIDPESVDKNTYGFINPLLVDPKDQKTLYMPAGKRMARFDNIDALEVVSSTAKLKTGWKFLDSITTASYTSNGFTTVAEITSMAMSKTNPNILYAGTNNREIFRIMDPGGLHPLVQRCSINRLPPTTSFVSDIAVDPYNAANVLVCYSNYGLSSLFYSSDTGNTWYLVGGNLESNQNSSGADPSIRCVEILVDQNGKRHYFAGTSIGLFSTDSLVLGVNGATNKTVWTQESPDQIGAAVVTDIKTRNTDGYIVVGTHGNGIFDSYYFGQKAPDAVILGNTLDVYPNPAQNEINYTFTNEEAGDVRAEILDMSGRRVLPALQAYYNAGTFTVKVNVSPLASGHYFLSLYGKSKRPKVKHFVVVKH